MPGIKSKDWVDVSKVIELHNKGLSEPKIATELGISRKTVHRRLYPEETMARTKWRRENVIHTTINGKNGWHRVVKRPQPPTCELCDKLCEKLHWHHWDPEHPEKGIWSCPTCHYFMEAVDAGLTEEHVYKYYRLKIKY